MSSCQHPALHVNCRLLRSSQPAKTIREFCCTSQIEILKRLKKFKNNFQKVTFFVHKSSQTRKKNKFKVALIGSKYESLWRTRTNCGSQLTVKFHQFRFWRVCKQIDSSSKKILLVFLTNSPMSSCSCRQLLVWNHHIGFTVIFFQFNFSQNFRS